MRKTNKNYQTLSQSNAAILNALPAFIALVDTRGVIRYVNDAWERLGHSNVFTGKNCRVGADYIQACEKANRKSTREAQTVSQGLQRVLAGKQKSFTLEYPCDTGTEQRWFRVIIMPISGLVGIATVVMHLNVTERRKAEEAVLESEERIEGIFRSAMDGIITVDSNQRIVMLNPAAELMFGYKSEEVMGKYLDQLIPERFRDKHHRNIRKFGQTGLTPRSMGKVGRVYGLRANGEEFPIEASISKVGIGKRQLLTVTMRDITIRLKAEEDLRNSEERFKAFMTHSPAVAFLKDEEGRYIYVNPSIKGVLNKPCEEWLGKTDQQLFPPGVARSLRKHDQEALQKGRVIEIEESTIDDEGINRHWLVFKFPVQSTGQGRFVGGVALDITSRKEMEKMLRERERELRQNQMELRALGGRLISAQEEERRRISRELHDDMNQRLAVLAFNIQAAQQQLVESDQMFKTLQNLYEQASSLSDDVRHLAYQLHPSILDDLGLEVALQSFVKDFSKWEGIRVRFISDRVPRTLPQEVASCLYRITQESLRNVARHAHASAVDLNLTFKNDAIKLCIKDNGMGFNVHTLPPEKKGLGLIGMQERIRLIRGTLTLDTRQGEGTEVCVSIPLPQTKRKRSPSP
jgi:PAS domain S-box-containing protein